MAQQYSSVLLEKAVNEFAKLPGIGRKTAMRLVLHLLRQDTSMVEAFSNALVTLKPVSYTHLTLPTTPYV